MKRRKKFNEINITNLVDVSLTILIVFIITAPMMTPGIDVNLPKVDASLPRDEQGITISINLKKEIFIEEKKIEAVKFEEVLSEIIKKKPPNVIVYIKADKNIDYGFVVEKIGKIKKLGINEVGLVAEIPEK